jgi:hypothetical protein
MAADARQKPSVASVGGTSLRVCTRTLRAALRVTPYPHPPGPAVCHRPQQPTVPHQPRPGPAVLRRRGAPGQGRLNRVGCARAEARFLEAGSKWTASAPNPTATQPSTPKVNDESMCASVDTYVLNAVAPDGKTLGCGAGPGGLLGRSGGRGAARRGGEGGARGDRRRGRRWAWRDTTRSLLLMPLLTLDPSTPQGPGGAADRGGARARARLQRRGVPAGCRGHGGAREWLGRVFLDGRGRGARFGRPATKRGLRAIAPPSQPSALPTLCLPKPAPLPQPAIPNPPAWTPRWRRPTSSATRPTQQTSGAGVTPW